MSADKVLAWGSIGDPQQSPQDMDDERCPCCGSLDECKCDINVVDGYDDETGYWREEGCTYHRHRI